ncbi:MAG: glutathione synthase [Myxococcales bacterium]|nr:glutathione synthase [Myxococcales bacterium]
MRFVFVMDPVSSVSVDEDTSFALMLEAQARGHRVYHCRERDVGLHGGSVRAHACLATMRRASERPIELGAPEWIALEDVDAVFVRKDPPFDDAYLWLTLVLEHLRGETLVINDPRGLREANEKLYTTFFSAVAPSTAVLSDREAIRAYVREVGGKAVIKPIDGHGGEGVFALNLGDKNFNAIVETVTRAGRRLAMVQELIPEVVEGDKRILLMAGEPLGAILRVPRPDDLRSNIHVGGSVVHAEIDAADERIIEAVRPRLLRDGLLFVGLDVIGGRLTEVNVTSPTGIQQMSRLSGRNCEAPVIDWIERRCAEDADPRSGEN